MRRGYIDSTPIEPRSLLSMAAHYLRHKTGGRLQLGLFRSQRSGEGLKRNTQGSLHPFEARFPERVRIVLHKKWLQVT